MLKKITFLLLGVSSIAADTYVIDTPGLYTFGGDMPYEPTGPDDTAILIACSNVIIDLMNYSIFQDVNLDPGLTAIALADNVNNITIRNGFINEISGVGIAVGDGCTNVTIQGMVIGGCNDAGISFDGTSSGITGALIERCNVNTSTGVSGSPAHGLRMVNSTTITVLDSSFSYNDAGTDSVGYGVYMDHCYNCIFSNVLFSNNGGLGGYGVYGSIVQDCEFLSCIARNTISRDLSGTYTAAGFYIEQGEDVVFDNTRSLEAQSSSGEAYGYLMRNGALNIFKGSFAGINTGAVGAAGFRFEEELSLAMLNNNVSQSNITTSTGFAFGIIFDDNCDKCQVVGNQIFDNFGVEGTVGVADTRNPSTTVFFKNYAFNNGTNFSVTYPVGVTFPVVEGDLNGTLGLPTTPYCELNNISVNP